jgi:hypothetical protein
MWTRSHALGAEISIPKVGRVPKSFGANFWRPSGDGNEFATVDVSGRR